MAHFFGLYLCTIVAEKMFMLAILSVPVQTTFTIPLNRNILELDITFSIDFN